MLVSIVSGLLRGAGRTWVAREKKHLWWRGRPEKRWREWSFIERLWRNKDQQSKLLPKSKLFTGIAKFSNRTYGLV